MYLHVSEGLQTSKAYCKDNKWQWKMQMVPLIVEADGHANVVSKKGMGGDAIMPKDTTESFK